MKYDNLIFKLIKVNSFIDDEIDIRNFFTRFPEYDSNILGNLQYDIFLHIESIGGGLYNKPFTFSIEPNNSFLIIFIRQGSVTIKQNNSKTVINEGNYLLINCNKKTEIQSLILDLNLELFMVTGNNMNMYLPVFEQKKNSILSSRYTEQDNMTVHDLYSLSDRCDQATLFKMHALITSLLSSLCIANSDKITQNETDQPYYLSEMHDYITKRYHLPFSLSLFEDQFRINKYRLCREYSESYRVSPLKDLNRHRLIAAKKLLLTTDLQIQEISSKVGFDSVTHFINMFKKEYGVTPKLFRENSQVTQ